MIEYKELDEFELRTVVGGGRTGPGIGGVISDGCTGCDCTTETAEGIIDNSANDGGSATS